MIHQLRSATGPTWRVFWGILFRYNIVDPTPPIYSGSRPKEYRQEPLDAEDTAEKSLNSFSESLRARPHGYPYKT